MSALLSVSDAHVSYGKVEAVRSVSLDVADNEIVTIIGANGAGKTTLLNAIMGVLPLKGATAFAGADMTPLDIEDRVAAGLCLVPFKGERAMRVPFIGALSAGAILTLAASSLAAETKTPITYTKDVAPKTPNDAVKKPDSSGKSTNALEVRVAANKIDYLVNGTTVHSTPKTGLAAKTDGIYGVRVNHLLEVQVDGLSKQ